MAEPSDSIPTLLPTFEGRQTTATAQADALREAILGGVFEDGQELNQVALAKHFGTSRVPVREALRQLQAEGLVRGEAYLRMVVNGLNIDRVTEIIDIRSALETYLLGRAIERAGEGYVEKLRALCDEMDDAPDHDAWLEGNRRFHDALCEPADAPIAADLVTNLSKRVARYLRLWSDGQGVHRNREANAEHRAIISHIEDGNRRRAVAELKRHIAHTRARVIALHGAYHARRTAEV
jgi:DNA-binding GntR family transcriptional regulator